MSSLILILAFIFNVYSQPAPAMFAVSSTEPTSELPDVSQAPYLLWERDLTLNRTSIIDLDQSQPLIDPSGHWIAVGALLNPGVHFFRLEDGLPLGSFKTRNDVQAPITLLDNGNILFSDQGGNIYCVKPVVIDEKLTFEQVWATELDVPVNTKVVVDQYAKRNQPSIFISAANDVVFSLHRDGSIAWRYEHRADPTKLGELKLKGASTPLVFHTNKQQLLTVGFSDGAVSVIDATAGNSLASTWLGQGRYPDIVSHPKLLEQSSSGEIFIVISSFDEPTALLHYTNNSLTVRWSIKQGSLHQPLQIDNQLLLSNNDGVLRTVDAFTGAEQQSIKVSKPGSLTTAILSGDYLLVASAVDSLTAVNHKENTIQWRFELGKSESGMMHAPTMLNRKIAYVSNQGWLRVLEFSAL